MFDDPSVVALGTIALVGLAAGLFGGVAAGARGLILIMLMGAMGAVAGAAVARVSGLEPVLDAGNGFSFAYGALGGLLLSYVVGRSDRSA